MLDKYWIEEDVLLVDKPKGPTSFHVIRQLRKILGVKKMGHAGTLDPLASGLMIIGINKGTKKMNNYLKLSKVYVATLLFGRSTTTSDCEGETILEKLPVILDDDEIIQAVQGLIGIHNLPVPLYSAIKVDGLPLYAYARAGQIPPRLPIKLMSLEDARLLSVRSEGGYILADIEMSVVSGTYIRSLVEELGRRLGYPAMLFDLRRISIDRYTINQAVLPDQARLPV